MRIALILATLLVQYFDDGGPPPDGPPPWPHGNGCYHGSCDPWQPQRFVPRYQTDERLCISRGDCLDPRRPRFQAPPFEGRGPRGYDYDWGE